MDVNFVKSCYQNDNIKKHIINDEAYESNPIFKIIKIYRNHLSILKSKKI